MSSVFMLYGAPTSGKGTLCKQFPQEHIISIGQLLRDKNLVQGANMVSSGIVNNILVEELNRRQDLSYILLDGYPRTSEQVKFIRSIPNIQLEKFIFLKCSDETVFKRTRLREACLCGASYMPVLKPPRIENICDLCGGKLYRRDDDDQSKVTKRLEVYHTETDKILPMVQDICLTIDMDNDTCFKNAARILAQTSQYFKFLNKTFNR